MAEILNAEKENVLESNISVLFTQDDIPGPFAYSNYFTCNL